MLIMRDIGKMIFQVEILQKLVKTIHFQELLVILRKLMGKYEWNKYVKSPTEIYKYRGQLKDTKIDGKGEFKWPDGRQYFGEF